MMMFQFGEPNVAQVSGDIDHRGFSISRADSFACTYPHLRTHMPDLIQESCHPQLIELPDFLLVHDVKAHECMTM